MMDRNWVLDHITIAVKDLEASKRFFTELFQAEFIKKVKLPRQNAVAAYFRIGDVMIGLESPLSEEGDIHKFIAKKGEGIHHLAFNVENLEEVEAQLKERNVQLIAHSSKPGIKKEFFTHPKSTMGLLIQLMEWEAPYKTSFDKRVETVGEE